MQPADQVPQFGQGSLGLVMRLGDHLACILGQVDELGPGQAYVIEPGHDAWVVGDEACVAFEFEPRAAEEYARG